MSKYFQIGNFLLRCIAVMLDIANPEYEIPITIEIDYIRMSHDRKRKRKRRISNSVPIT